MGWLVHAVNRRSRLLRAVASVVVVAVVASLVAVIGSVGTAPKAHAAEIFFGDYGDGPSHADYGPNATILIDGDLAGGCYDMFGFYKADVYVVPHGSIDPSASADLGSLHPTDVIQTDLTDGLFVGETIGYTAPAGALGNGDYDVVLDMCDYGHFDPGSDLVIGAGDPHGAISVTIPVDVPILPDPTILALKSAAGDQAAQWRETAAATGLLWDALKKLQDKVGSLDPADKFYRLFLTLECIGLFPDQAKFDRHAQWGWDCPAADPGSYFTTLVGEQTDLARKYEALHNDPADPNSSTPVLLGPTTSFAPTTDEPTEAAFDTVGTLASTSAATIDALRHTIEKYDGAAASGNGRDALLQARAMAGFADLARQQLQQTDSGLDSLQSALDGSGVDFSGESADLVALQQQVRASGLPADVATKLRGSGLSSQGLALAAAEMAQTEAENPDATLTADSYADHGPYASLFDSIRASDASLTSALGDLATAARANAAQLVTTLGADPLPTADAGGPYTATAGVPVTLDASASTAPASAAPLHYGWDLHGTGTFTDASGAQPSVTFAAPGRYLVGVDVTDAAGGSAVAYAPVMVGAAHARPVITAVSPDPIEVDPAVGAPVTFGVTASSPGGDPLTYRWTLDGSDVGTDAAWTHTFGITDGGTHTVDAYVSNAGGTTMHQFFVVVPAPVGLTVTADSTDLLVHATTALHATASYADGSTHDVTSAVTWHSQTPAVATVAPDGTVTAVAPGGAGLQATLGELTGGVSVNVTSPATVTTLAISPNGASINEGTSQPFSVVAAYSDGTTGDVTATATWTTADPSVATVDPGGLVRGVAPGATTLSATYKGVTGTVGISVAAVSRLTSIEITPADAAVVAGSTLQLHATGYYTHNGVSDLTSQVTWTADPGVATISASGLATGVATGSTTVTATLGGITGTTSLDVVPARVLTSITVDPSSVTLQTGGTVRPTVTGHWSDQTTTDESSHATWSSSDTSVATVAADGTITGGNPGPATVSASVSGLTADVAVTVVTPPVITDGNVPGPVFYSRAPDTGSLSGTIWRRSADGTSDTLVTTGENPVVSPDGRYLAFRRLGSYSSGDPVRQDVWVRDLQAGTEQRIFTNTDFVVSMSWTSDDQLVFDSVCSIVRANADGSGRVTLMSTDCYDDAPAVSPDSQQIAFQNVHYGIGLAGIDGSGRHFVPNTRPGDVGVRWSPDGKWLSFVRPGSNGHPSSYDKIHPDGTGLTQLTTLAIAGDGVGALGAWSGDGSQIVAVATVGGQTAIYAISASGDGTIVRLPVTAGNVPTWADAVPGLTVSPGHSFVAVGSTGTFTATVDGPPGTPVEFTVTGANPQGASLLTGADGTAVFTYAVTHTGFDTITASAAIGGATVTTTATAVTTIPLDEQLTYTIYQGSIRLKKGHLTFDGHTFALTDKTPIAPSLPNADGLAYAPDGAIIVGGQGTGVYRVDPTTGTWQRTTEAAGDDNHISIDPSGNIAWAGWSYAGTYGVSEVPINPWTGGSVRHSVHGDDPAVDTIAWTPDGTAFYTFSSPGGNGSFGIIDMTTFTTHRLLSGVAAAHGMSYDPYTGDLLLFGSSHITQIDVSDHQHPRIVSDRSFGGLSASFDQGGADGHGHVFVANNDGHLLFIDYSATGLVGSPANFVALPFIDSYLDDVAPLVGPGALPPTPPPAATTLTYTGDTTGDVDDSATLAGTLVETASGRPLAGAAVTFTLGGQSCDGVTGTDGAAQCSVVVAGPANTRAVGASFAGRTGDLASSATGSFTANPEETVLTYTGDTALLRGRPATLSGVLTEDADTPLAGRTVSFSLGAGATAQTCTGVTDVAGAAHCTILAVEQDTGAGTAHAAFAGDASLLPAGADTATVVHTPTAITYTGDVVTDHADTASLAARLVATDGVSEQPMPGTDVTLTFAGASCQATTDATGQARCAVEVTAAAGPATASASYAGDSLHAAATSTVDAAVVREETTVTYQGPATSHTGDQVTLAATLLADGDLAQPVADRTLTLALGADSCTATTGSDGRASCAVTAPGTSGPAQVTAAFAGDDGRADGDLFRPSTTTVPMLVIGQQPTTLTYTGATSGDYHDQVTLAASLTSAAGPVTGRAVSLAAGSAGCQATTDATGTASCPVVLADPSGTLPVTATFAGDDQYAPSSATASLVAATEETGLTVTAPAAVGTGDPVTLSGVLVEDPGSASVPVAGRQVAFTLGSGPAAQSCTGTTDAGGAASCTIAAVTQPLGPTPVSASFAGDAYYRPATAAASTIAYAWPAGGVFAVGDRAGSTVGASAYFWGSQWWSRNPVSGASAAQFKGYLTSAGHATCGDMVTAAPGDSGNPPSGLPGYLAVVVTDGVTSMQGTLAMRAVHVVVVRVAPGYAGDPGHPGQGTVVATVC